jgi:dUTPase
MHTDSYDLSAAYDVEIKAQGKAIVKTDLAVAMPEGVYGRIAPRSGTYACVRVYVCNVYVYMCECVCVYVCMCECVRV